MTEGAPQEAITTAEEPQGAMATVAEPQGPLATAAEPQEALATAAAPQEALVTAAAPQEAAAMVATANQGRASPQPRRRRAQREGLPGRHPRALREVAYHPCPKARMAEPQDTPPHWRSTLPAAAAQASP